MSLLPDYNFKLDKRAKGTKLRVDVRGVWIVSNRNLNQQNIQKLLEANLDWITKQLSKYQFEQPKSILVAGDEYTIEYANVHDFSIGENTIKVHDSEEGYQAMLKWLKRQSKKYLKQKTDELATQHRFDINRIAIRDQYTRWGSCSSKGNINLNWRLVMAPVLVTEYVIIHELAHLKEMNHSHKFWNLVAQMQPNYKEHLRWLKTHGAKLHAI